MGIVYNSKRVRSYIMIFLVVLSFFLVFPIKKGLMSFIDNKVTVVTDMIYEKTGLKISYKSLSPSVLTSFYVKNISIFNDEGKNVLDIDNVHVNYNIFKLIKLDIKNGINNVVLDGINLDLNDLLRIIQLFHDKSAETEFNLEEILKYIPKNVALKNLNLSYGNDDIEALLNVKDLFISDNSNNRSLELDLNSSLNVNLPKMEQRITTKLAALGSITSDFDNSQMNIKLSDIKGNDFNIEKLNLHAGYNDNNVEIHTFQVSTPVSVGATYNIEKNNLDVKLVSEKIKPVSIAASSFPTLDLEMFKDVELATSTVVSFDFNNKDIKYDSVNDITLPQSLFPGGMDVVLNVNGDGKKLNIKNLSLNSRICKADANLDFVFDTFQMSGNINLPYFVLPGGNTISTAIYFSPQRKGFSGIAPSLSIGEKLFSDVHLNFIPNKDSLDFSIKLEDESENNDEDQGVIEVAGSYLMDSKYIQTNLSLKSFPVGSLTNAAAEFLPQKNRQQLIDMHETFSPFILSGDMYLSTDLKSLSYNVPYLIVANTQEDNQVVMLSLNGNEQNIQVDQFSLAYGKIGLQANAFIDRNPDTSDLFFDANITSSSIPYHFTGTIMPEIITIMGDYDTNLELRFNDDNIDGYLEINDLPINLFNKSFVLSTYSELNYDKEYGPSVKIDRFDVEMIDTEKTINPKLVLSGSATQYGVQIDSLAYSDYYSTLEGQAGVMLDLKENVLEAASINVNLQNPLSSENIVLTGNVSNPDRLELSGETLLNDIYLDIQAQLNDFCLDRFVKEKNNKNLITASVFASGTVMHPSVTVGVENLNAVLGGTLLKANGNILLEDRDFSVIDFDLGFGGIEAGDIQVNASLNDMTIDSSFNLYVDMGGTDIKTPVKLNVKNTKISEDGALESFDASLKASKVDGSFMKKSFPMELYINHSKAGTSLKSSKNIGLSGFLDPDGIFQLDLDNGAFLSAKADGYISPDVTDIVLYDINANLGKLFKYINLDDFVMFDDGDLTGELVITGSMLAPDIDGNLLITLPVFKLPFITPEKLSTDEVNVEVVDNVIKLPETVFKARKDELLQVSLNMYLNKLIFDYLEGEVKTVGEKLFPANLFLGVMDIVGNVNLDAKVFIQDSVISITGDVFGEDMEFNSGISSVTNVIKSTASGIEVPVKFKIDLNAILGTHASANFSPVLRCILVPNTKLRLFMDQSTGEFFIDGELKIRSGDVAYLNRNFYIKNGSIKFNEDDIANPLVTLVADTREQDINGDSVKIILEVDNQYLMDLKPKFRAEPAKSEMEIQSILGQLAVGDSDNAKDLIFAAGDYAFQTTFVRRIENKLRDLLNFDIFSLRTNVLQNTLNWGMSGNLTKETFSIGNFLDNSTVYIGKYLGSSLYLDAMLHVSFEHDNLSDITSSGSVLFQPEVGLEMESPFANIRFNLAPDMNSLIKNNQFVPSTSVTLSWDFTF